MRAGLRPAGRCPLFRGIEDGSYVYFVHPYPEPEEPPRRRRSRTTGVTFASAVWKGNLMATQFHPEKSQRVGLAMIRNFVAFGRSGARPKPRRTGARGLR